ncbi:ThuA domain-containing protein [Gilvimarinus sp. SDUM040013]|uniref:ThuA domain-containing protein n=1 Tax=Gilvimarinus gilvus TaxID=3058038 RepID=A0ABU4RZ14_9GAMM|nr:ThuA domain-containing protein [Gilvimarinus sp. SDUM040013]MDO3387612.1 ThuA domain-containing protein [Gilvimarinus sp. SDUM040013]MDX6850123.1 ThuA domain-containing protein [Gilvimarinus sp. SDUM040013]
MRKFIAKLALMVGLMTAALPALAEQFSVLLFTKTAGWHHESINAGVTAMKKMAERHHFKLDWHEMSSVFADDRLKNYDAVVFLNTTADILNDDQQAAMERFIQSGKGFVGIHSASDTEYEWDWYTKMVGRTFHIHPAIQTAEIDVIDRKFPGVERMPDTFLWTDEFYEFGAERIDSLNYILSIDESTYDPVADWGRVAGEGMGDFHPIAWYHEYDGGRAFYTGLGHVPSTFEDKMFLEHIYGGLYWAATGKGMRK